MGIKIKRIVLTLLLAMALVVTSSVSLLAESKELSNPEDSSVTFQYRGKLGLAFLGNGIVSSQGNFYGMYYLTKNQLESIKDELEVGPTSATLDNTDISGCLTEGLYSACDNHGGVNHHYYNAKGIDIAKSFDKLGLDISPSNVKALYIQAGDKHSDSLLRGGNVTDIFNSYKRFDPGQTESNVTVPAIVSLFKSSNEADYPDAAVRCDENGNTLIFGQTSFEMDNNCKFVKNTDSLFINDYPFPIKNDNEARNNILYIYDLLREGIYDATYEYDNGENKTTYDVTGIPLKDVLSKFNLEKYTNKESYAGLLVTDKNNVTHMINKENVENGLVAWGEKNGKSPEGQDDCFAIYTDVSNQTDGIITNVRNITAVDKDGNILDDSPDTVDTTKPSVNNNFQNKTIGVTAPKKTKIKSIKKSKKRSVILKWEKVKGTSGYEIYRSTKRKGKYKKIKEIKKAKTTKYINKKLKRGKRYYFKIRTYKIAGGEKYYSGFSKIRSVKR